MNNYLTSIAARTLNPDHSVRPRLGGRFEPASLAEGPIDSANSFRRPAAKHSQPESQQVGGIETAEERDSNSRSLNTFDPAPQLDRPAALTPRLNSAATTEPPVTGSVVDPSPSLTIRAPNQQTAAEAPRQNMPVELRPDEKVVDLGERSEFRRSRPTESGSENKPEPRFEESPGRSVRAHRPTAEEVELTPAPISSRTIRPSSSASDEQEPVALPANTRKQPLVERELETIVIREKVIRDEPSHNQSSTKPPPTPVAESSGTTENSRSITPPVVVHSRIAPLLETGPEVQLNRPTIQPQPTIHVTIARIEVRAVQSSQSPTKSRAATPVMNLDDYLKRRSQGGAR